MLFAGDIILINETRFEINNKLEFLGEVLKFKSLKFNKTKPEYMVCKYSNKRQR